MLRCFSTLGCPDFSLAAALDLAARHGLAAVELRTLGGTLDLAGHLTAAFGSPDRLAAHLRAACPPVGIASLDSSLHLVNPTATDQADLLRLAAWADGLGVRWLRVFDGGRLADTAEIAAAAATWRWWREQRAAHGWAVDVMVETHDSLCTAAAIGRLLATVPDAAILWDAHHTWRKGGEDPMVTWRAIRPRVVHVHVKDSIAVPSARHPFTYTLPGDGGFPMAALRAMLAADAYTGFVCLEWEKRWHPYLPPLEDALRVAAARAWW